MRRLALGWCTGSNGARDDLVEKERLVQLGFSTGGSVELCLSNCRDQLTELIQSTESGKSAEC